MFPPQLRCSSRGLDLWYTRRFGHHIGFVASQLYGKLSVLLIKWRNRWEWHWNPGEVKAYRALWIIDCSGLKRMRLRHLSPFFLSFLCFFLFWLFVKWSVYVKKLVSSYFLVIRCCKKKKVLVEVIILWSFFIFWSYGLKQHCWFHFPVDAVAVYALNTQIWPYEAKL